MLITVGLRALAANGCQYGDASRTRRDVPEESRPQARDISQPTVSEEIMKSVSEVGVSRDVANTISGVVDQTHRARDLRRFWRRTLACLVPIPMLALTAASVVRPFSVDGDLRDAMAGVAAEAGAAQIMLWLSVFFALTVAPATMAVAWTGRRRAPWATLAAGFSLLVAFGAGLPDTDLAVVTATARGLDPGQVAAVNDAVATHPAAVVNT